MIEITKKAEIFNTTGVFNSSPFTRAFISSYVLCLYQIEKRVIEEEKKNVDLRFVWPKKCELFGVTVLWSVRLVVILRNWRICYSDRGDGWQDMRLFLLYTWWDLGVGSIEVWFYWRLLMRGIDGAGGVVKVGI